MKRAQHGGRLIHRARDKPVRKQGKKAARALLSRSRQDAARPGPAKLREKAAGVFPSRSGQDAKHPGSRQKKARQPALSPQQGGIQLYTVEGARKYVTAEERKAFLQEAEKAERSVHTLCMTLVYSGCRLSEALALTADRVDLTAGVLVFASLKKRRPGIFRAVPVPPALLTALDMVHGIRELQSKRGKGRGVRLWPWSRMTGWRAVHQVMEAAGLEGAQACPKGLRHGFGVAAVTAGIPLNLVQKWLGHAQLSTTAIYANAIGTEEKDIAGKMWG